MTVGEYCICGGTGRMEAVAFKNPDVRARVMADIGAHSTTKFLYAGAPSTPGADIGSGIVLG